jgi:hypothetical protein
MAVHSLNPFYGATIASSFDSLTDYVLERSYRFAPPHEGTTAAFNAEDVNPLCPAIVGQCWGAPE